jgi:predicted permease
MVSELAVRAAVAVQVHAGEVWAGSVPNPSPDAPEEFKNAVNKVIALVRYSVIAACAIGVLIVAVKAVLAHRRGHEDAFAGLAAVAGGCILVASGASLVGFLT